MRRFFHQPCAWGLVFSFFVILPQRIVGNEPNLDCFQHMYGATLKILVLCVS